jgi:hypothetical protein
MLVSNKHPRLLGQVINYQREKFNSVCPGVCRRYGGFQDLMLQNFFSSQTLNQNKLER